MPRNRTTTGVSKRGAKQMMLQAVYDAVTGLPDVKQRDAEAYLNQLKVDTLTQNQMMAIESLVDLAFRGGQALTEEAKRVP